MREGATVRPFDGLRDRPGRRQWPGASAGSATGPPSARNDKGSVIDVSPPPHTRSFRPCQVGALGDYWVAVVGIDRIPFDPEEGVGVWGDLFGGDGFYGPVPAGYGGPDPDRGRGGAQDGIRPCV